MSEDSPSSSFCPAPWTTLASSNDGHVQICCRALKPLRDDEGNQIPFLSHSLDSIWNSDAYQQVRQAMLIGQRLPYCTRCYQEEDRGLLSRRQRSIANNQREMGDGGFVDWISHLKLNKGIADSCPSHVEVRLGSRCNLRCRICAPEFSHLIRKEMESLLDKGCKLPGFYSENLQLIKDRDDSTWQKDYIDKILSTSSTIRSLYLAGGEPFVTPSYQGLIDGLIQSRDSHHIKLTINTNGTVATANWLTRLAQFESVELYISLDSVGRALEYQRTGVNWQDIQVNLEKFLELGERVHIKIFPTLSIYNILEIADLLSWFGEFHHTHCENVLSLQINILHTPKFLQATLLPQEFVPEIEQQLEHLANTFSYFNQIEGKATLDKIRTVLSQCESRVPNQNLNDLWDYTQLMDKQYNQKLADYCPQTARVFSVLKNSIGCCE
ncbi:MAG: twitch domain-containing radical SAM protein [Bdellovibrionales bacterium]|nr:twitch domain-containing radical SAM protein [Bdellovibrionales bacterium]